MNANISVFVICVETIIYWLLYNLHDSAFKEEHHAFKFDSKFNKKSTTVSRFLVSQPKFSTFFVQNQNTHISLKKHCT